MLLDNFSKNLIKFRTNSNLSQSSLGKSLGISRQTISYYETGAREPDLVNLVKLATFFNCSIDDLVFNDGDVKREDVSSLEGLNDILQSISSDSLIYTLKEKRKELEYYYHIIPKKIKTLDSMINIIEKES